MLFEVIPNRCFNYQGEEVFKLKKYVYGFMIFALVVYGLLQLRESFDNSDTNIVIEIKDKESLAYVSANVSTYPGLGGPQSGSISGNGRYVFQLGGGMPAIIVVKTPGYHTKARMYYISPGSTKTIFLSKSGDAN